MRTRSLPRLPTRMGTCFLPSHNIVQNFWTSHGSLVCGNVHPLSCLELSRNRPRPVHERKQYHVILHRLQAAEDPPAIPCVRQVTTTYTGTYSAGANCTWQFGTAADAGKTVAVTFLEFLVDLTYGDNLTVSPGWAVPGAPEPQLYNFLNIPALNNATVLPLPLQFKFQSNHEDHRYASCSVNVPSRAAGHMRLGRCASLVSATPHDGHSGFNAQLQRRCGPGSARAVQGLRRSIEGAVQCGTAGAVRGTRAAWAKGEECEGTISAVQCIVCVCVCVWSPGYGASSLSMTEL